MRYPKFLLLLLVIPVMLSTQAQSVKAGKSKTSKAQSTKNIGPYSHKKVLSVGLGLANYYGDLTENSKIFNQSSFSFTGGFAYGFGPYFSLLTEASIMRLHASDSKNDGAQYKNRNLSFKSNVYELSTAIEFNFVNLYKHRFSPYIFIGVGGFYFNPYTNDATGNKRVLQPLGTEGQGLAQYPDRKLYKRLQGNIPLGGGFKYNVSKLITLQLDFKYRITGTDYIDDVSLNSYPNPTFLAPSTATLTYRGSEVGAGPYPTNLFLPRGNPAKRDVFYTTQLKLAFNLDKTNKTRTIKPTPPPPAAVEPVLDRDGDGVPDVDDKCPDEKGLAALKGCPDRDGDGVADADDKCPDVKGLVALNGCPDGDGDGVADADDKCPEIAGVAKYQGCPIPDTDGDGVNDEEDKCPNVKGPIDNFGCPLEETYDPSLDDKDAKKVYFETGKSNILPRAFPNLNSIVSVLKQNPTYEALIYGHTDYVGSDEYNQTLSEERASSVKTYLINKGIDEGRISTTGYGETKPIANNSTAAGRTLNRRVVIILKNY